MPSAASEQAAPVAEPAPPRVVSFATNKRRRVAEREADGWILNREIELLGGRGAVLVYEPTPERAEARLTIELDVVTHGDTIVSEQSSMLHVPEAGPIHDLRGDGSRYVVLVLTDCGANCAPPRHLVVEITDAGLAPPESVPECPTCRYPRPVIVGGVSRPVFERAVHLELGDCSRAACGPLYALVAELPLFEVWDGERFSSDVAALRAVYTERLAAATESVKTVAPSHGCPLLELELAIQLYAYQRIRGMSATRAWQLPDSIMAARSLAPCTQKYALFKPAPSWAELKARLAELSLPNLE